MSNNYLRTICLKCGHNIDMHKISIIGNYEGLEVRCNFDGYESCECDAGFKKVMIKKEFTSMAE